MRILKVCIGNVTYNRRTRERHVEIITEEERHERELKRNVLERRIASRLKREKELDRKASKKKRRPKKGCMDGKWLKNVYGK